MANILVVEDNRENRELMVYLLHAFGHEIFTADDGEQAVEALETSMFDLVICDVHLPKKDGYQVLAAARRNSALARVPIVAVTALAMVGDREKVLRAGFDGYIEKPIEPAQFVSQIERHLGDVGEATRQPVAGVPARETRSNAAAPGRILVVDDVEQNREVLKAMLAPLGYDVTMCGSVAEAVAAARATSFDLVLSDLRMPVADGMDFLVSAKNSDALRDVPFLVITSSKWTDKERADALRLGAAGFLERPMDPRDLIDEVTACLNRHHGP